MTNASRAVPRLTLERKLLREYDLVISCDEVGRGALAGPVAVGATVTDAALSRRRVPEGLRDSKLIPEPRRAELARRAAGWVVDSAVGWASSAEIDEIGIDSGNLEISNAAGKETVSLKGVRTKVMPDFNIGSWEIKGLGGKLRIQNQPEMNLKDMALRWQGKNLFLNN